MSIDTLESLLPPEDASGLKEVSMRYHDLWLAWSGTFLLEGRP